MSAPHWMQVRLPLVTADLHVGQTPENSGATLPGSLYLDVEIRRSLSADVCREEAHGAEGETLPTSNLRGGAVESGGESHDWGDEFVTFDAVAFDAACLAGVEVVCWAEVVDGVWSAACEWDDVVCGVCAVVAADVADACSVGDDLRVAFACCSCSCSLVWFGHWLFVLSLWFALVKGLNVCCLLVQCCDSSDGSQFNSYNSQRLNDSTTQRLNDSTTQRLNAQRLGVMLWCCRVVDGVGRLGWGLLVWGAYRPGALSTGGPIWWGAPCWSGGVSEGRGLVRRGPIGGGLLVGGACQWGGMTKPRSLWAGAVVEGGGGLLQPDTR